MNAMIKLITVFIPPTFTNLPSFVTIHSSCVFLLSSSIGKALYGFAKGKWDQVSSAC